MQRVGRDRGVLIAALWLHACGGAGASGGGSPRDGTTPDDAATLDAGPMLDGTAPATEADGAARTPGDWGAPTLDARVDGGSEMPRPDSGGTDPDGIDFGGADFAEDAEPDAAVRPDAALPLVPGLPPGFVRIEAGVFTMGSPFGEPGRSGDLDLIEVEIFAPFALKATEVTQAEWQAVMGTNPSEFGPNGVRDDCGPTCPVERVSWFDAVAYLNRLSDDEGLTRCYSDDDARFFQGADCNGYRLPTEAEWEYAARGGSGAAFSSGAITALGCLPLDPNLDTVGWYCGNSGESTHPVGLKLPNGWGLFDVHGNVGEWVQGALDVRPFVNGGFDDGPAPDPGLFQNNLGDTRIVRGGSWSDTSEWARAAARLAPAPSDISNGFGFRPARSL